MALDISADALIRSGAGAFYVALGVFILWIRPRTMANFGLGAFCVANGLSRIIFFLVGGSAERFDPQLIVPALWTTTALNLASGLALLSWAWQAARPLPPRAKTWACAFFVTSLVSGLAWSAVAVQRTLTSVGLQEETQRAGSRAGALAVLADAASFFLVVAAYVAVTIVVVHRLRQGESRRSGAGLVLLAVALLVEPLSATPYWLRDAVHGEWLVRPWDALLLSHPLLLVAVLLLFATTASAAHAFARNAALGLLTYLLGQSILVVAFEGQNFGFDGVVLLLALLGLAYAILRLDLLAVPLPLWTKRPGLAAAAGLTTLFVTAQVAQNFVSDQLSLAAGAAAAAALVLLAIPLQRAAERALGFRRAPDASTAYRRQVEIAWQDGRLGANERLMLAETRRQLGLSLEEAEKVDEDVAAASLHRRKK